jgi:S1-C subfamily serine protease
MPNSLASRTSNRVFKLLSRFQAFRIIAVTALLACAATVVVMRWDLVPGYKEAETISKTEAARAATAKGQPPLSAEEEINVQVYKKVSPGVVNITSTEIGYDFFLSPVASSSTGSGCVIDIDGNVLTNYHVIENAEPDGLEVALPDQTKYRARIVGYDDQNDLAVIRLINAPKERLHPIALGDSDSLIVGQKVLAIGNPFRLQNTLTAGIISSLGRRIKTESGTLIESVIQTDAAINPGNSGGPLLNTAGEMIGINTQIVSPSGASNGVGFAIPSNTIRRVASDLIKEGRVVRPNFGVEGYPLNEDLAEALDLPVKSGFLVAIVHKGSSAESAGIRGASRAIAIYRERVMVGGDIIVAVDNKPITSAEELKLALEPKRPGETIKVTIYRQRTKMDLNVLLAEVPRQRNMTF